MKRFIRLWLLTPLLAACGPAAGPSLSVAPMSAGELLLAPTQLSVGGVKLRAEARPTLLSSCGNEGCSNFVVPVKLRGDSTLPLLKMTGVYVVTEGGVWRSGIASRDSRRCAEANCWQAAGRGYAALSTSDAVQVIVTFKDAAGRSYKLRDMGATISAMP